MKKFLSLLLAAAMLLGCASALADDSYIENQNLAAWAAYYSALHEAAANNGQKLADTCMPYGNVKYTPGYNVRSCGVKGKDVADDGLYSDNGTFTMGMGAGVKDESLWYVSFTYDDATDRQVKVANTMFMIQALMLPGIIGELDQDTIIQIASKLVGATGDVAYEVDGMVLCAKPQFGLVMANSKAFYDAYYPNSIKDYTKVR